MRGLFAQALHDGSRPNLPSPLWGGIGGLRPPFLAPRTPMRSIGFAPKRSGGVDVGLKLLLDVIALRLNLRLVGIEQFDNCRIRGIASLECS